MNAVVQSFHSLLQTLCFFLSGLVLNAEHPYYVILDEPLVPWSLKAGNRQNVRPEFLEVACGAAEGERAKPAALAKLTQHLFSGRGYCYDYHMGREWVSLGKCFYMKEYLFNAERMSITHIPRPVNCLDQAVGLALIGRGIGLESTISCISNNSGLYIKPNLLVGDLYPTNNPFYRTNGANYCTERICEHTNHPAGIIRSSFVKHCYVLHDGKIYDACVGPALGTQANAEYLYWLLESQENLQCEELGVNYVVE